jgi:hypothetical protein
LNNRSTLMSEWTEDERIDFMAKNLTERYGTKHSEYCGLKAALMEDHDQKREAALRQQGLMA